MEITGKIIVVLPESSGVSKANKPWKKREYVLETLDGQFPQKIHFDFFGERADQYPLQVGQVIKLSFDINSREYNGRWYTNISGWRAEEVSEVAPATPTPGNPSGIVSEAPNAYGTSEIPPFDSTLVNPKDDLPF